MSASLQLKVHNDLGFVSHVFSEQRRKGHARGLMTMVCEYADAHKLILILDVGRYGHPIGPDDNVLEQFYKEFGFRNLPPNTFFGKKAMERPLVEEQDNV